MSERRVFEIPQSLRDVAYMRYATVVGGCWEWYGSKWDASCGIPDWPLNQPTTSSGERLNSGNERIRQWLLKELEGDAQFGVSPLAEGMAYHAQMERVMRQHRDASADILEKETQPLYRMPEPAKKHVRIELPLERVIHNCPMAPCEMWAARTLACAEEWRRKEAALREFKRNRREWPRCCGDECEVEYVLGDAAVVVRCKHD